MSKEEIYSYLFAVPFPPKSPDPMKIFNVFVLLFLALLCGGKSSFAQFAGNVEPATPTITNGTISWVQDSLGTWVAGASLGKYTVSNPYTFSNKNYVNVSKGVFSYVGEVS